MRTQLNGITMSAVIEIVLAYKEAKKKAAKAVKKSGKGETCVIGKRPVTPVPEQLKTKRI